MKKTFILSLLIFILSSADVFAGKRYYIMGIAGTWNTTLSWSTTSGGSSGASVPGSSDTAYFDGNGLGACTLDANVNVKRLEIASGYTGIITQLTNTVTIGTGGAVLSGGTFLGGTANITLSGACTISGCAFTSTSGTFSTNSNFTVSSGSFTNNSGKISITSTMTLASSITGGTTFYDLDFAPTLANPTITITSTTPINVSNLLSIGGTKYTTFNTGTINVQGNFSTANATVFGGGGNATFNFNGTGPQSLTGNSTSGNGRLPHIAINKSADTLSLSGIITTGGNWTRTAGSVRENSAVMVMWGSSTISGGPKFHTVWFAPGSLITVSGNMDITTLMAYGGGASNCPTINSGTIRVQGNVNLSYNTYAGGTGGTGTIEFNGTGDQDFIGSVVGSARVCNININKSSGTLTLSSYIMPMKNWTYVSGTLDAGTSTIYFFGAKTISGSHTVNNVLFGATTNTTYTISSGTVLTVNGGLTIGGGGNPISINSGTIYAKGTITNNNISGSSGGTGTITINGTTDQTLNGGDNLGEAKFPNMVIDKPAGTLSLVGVISPAANWTYAAGTINPGTSTVFFATSKTISGSHTLYNVHFSGGANYTYTITSGTILTVSGDLDFSGSKIITLNTGQIDALGNITTTNSSLSTTGTALIRICGTSNDTLTGSGTAGAGNLPNVTIDKTGGTLTLASIISVNGNWTYNQGTVDPATSTVAFYGTFNLDGQQEGSANCMPFYNIAVNGGTRTLTGNVDANNNFTIGSGATCSAGPNKIYVGGDWNSTGTWTYGTSTVVFDGNGYNKIQGTGTINFANVEFNRVTKLGTPSKSISLNNPVIVNTSATFNLGRLKTDTTNYLQFADNATCTVTNDDSAYVHGPVRKVGDDAFTFPLGDTTLHDSIAYHPLAITAPSATSDRFQAQYYALGQTVGDSIVDSLADVSNDEYWKLDRQVGTSNVYVTLSWNQNSGNVQDYNTLRVANWNGAKWLDLGGSNISVSNRTGSVTAVAPPSYVTNSALLTTSNMVWTQDYAVLHRKLDGGYYLVKNGALYFMYDEEYNDTDDKLSFTIYDQQRRTVATSSGSNAITRTSDYGDNRFFINLLDCNTNANGYVGSGTYILEVTNEKNEKWMLRFKHVTTIIPLCPGGGGGGGQ